MRRWQRDDNDQGGRNGNSIMILRGEGSWVRQGKDWLASAVDFAGEELGRLVLAGNDQQKEIPP